MGKKIKAEMEAQRKQFVDGAGRARRRSRRSREHIFDLVAKFAGYGFNKSHAAAYALVAYQTAYLKANYPVEFLAASMSLDIGNTDKLNVFRQECARLGIKLLPPDINRSEVDFAVEPIEDGTAIRYALAAVKGVGAAAMREILAERKANGAVQGSLRFRAPPRCEELQPAAIREPGSAPAPSIASTAIARRASPRSICCCAMPASRPRSGRASR